MSATTAVALGPDDDGGRAGGVLGDVAQGMILDPATIAIPAWNRGLCVVSEVRRTQQQKRGKYFMCESE